MEKIYKNNIKGEEEYIKKIKIPSIREPNLRFNQTCTKVWSQYQNRIKPKLQISKPKSDKNSYDALLKLYLWKFLYTDAPTCG